MKCKKPLFDRQSAGNLIKNPHRLYVKMFNQSRNRSLLENTGLEVKFGLHPGVHPGRETKRGSSTLPSPIKRVR
mgnify:CR=1 FL=1